MAKAIADGLNRIAWVDDSQVTRLSVTQAGIDRDRPRAEVRVDQIATAPLSERQTTLRHHSG